MCASCASCRKTLLHVRFAWGVLICHCPCAYLGTMYVSVLYSSPPPPPPTRYHTPVRLSSLHPYPDAHPVQTYSKYITDRALPFGLCSTPKIFNAVTDFIAWVLRQHGIAYQFHYPDDFSFSLGPLLRRGSQSLGDSLEGAAYAWDPRCCA